ncbi:MAG: hypothetical protein LBG63_01080 [Candidatus Methanoplasma sp.]|jgi:hypothetical protein|nr:hypothetical protein [Candidatus Methanoplasma sp.]
MSELTIKYAVFMTVISAPIVAIFAVWCAGYISFTESLVLLFFIVGAASIYWGCYYMRGGEALTATVDFFIGKKNHADHDIERMVRDLGKLMIAIGGMILTGSFLLYSTSNLFLIAACWVLALVVFIAFSFACKKGEYLKTL